MVQACLMAHDEMEPKVLQEGGREGSTHLCVTHRFADQGHKQNFVRLMDALPAIFYTLEDKDGVCYAPLADATAAMQKTSRNGKDTHNKQ